MANFYGQARSNYFAVKDEEAFRTAIAELPIRLIEKKNEADDTNLFGFLDADEDGQADVWSIWDEVKEEQVEIDWSEFFKKHLADDWVAVIISVGWEKYRYFQGDVVAFNNKGESKTINLDTIYEIVGDLGANVTHASY